jgi:hypothetical protein
MEVFEGETRKTFKRKSKDGLGMRKGDPTFDALVRSRKRQAQLLDTFDEEVLRAMEEELRLLECFWGELPELDDQVIGARLRLLVQKETDSAAYFEGNADALFVQFVLKYPICDKDYRPINMDRPEYKALAQSRVRNLTTQGLALPDQIQIFQVMARQNMGIPCPTTSKAMPVPSGPVFPKLTPEEKDACTKVIVQQEDERTISGQYRLETPEQTAEREAKALEDLARDIQEMPQVTADDVDSLDEAMHVDDQPQLSPIVLSNPASGATTPVI